MRKVFTLFFVVLCSLSIFGNTYWYRGEVVSESWDAAPMTISDDGFYEYYALTQGGSFKITTGANSWDPAYGSSKLRTGFNGTDFTANKTGVKDIRGWDGGDTENIYAVSNEGTWYVIIYYPNTTVNPGTDPIICASTTLPNNPKYYITGNAALVSESVAWNGKAVSSSSDSYTFTNLPAGEYQLVVLPTGNWGEFDRKYTALTDNTDAGLTGDGDDNICFRLTEPADVTVTYIKTSESSVFTVTTTGEFFSLEEGYYLVGTFSGVDKRLVTDLTADKKFTLNQYLGNNKDEYKLNITVAEGDRFKAAYVYKNSISSLVPAEGDDYVIQAAQAGDVTIYFRYDYSGTTWGCNFYVEQNKGTALDNTVDGKKAVKRIVDGQLVIIKNGVKYNALGAEVK